MDAGLFAEAVSVISGPLVARLFELFLSDLLPKVMS